MTRAIALKIFSYLVIVAFAFYLASRAVVGGSLSVFIAEYGYLGIFFLSIVSGINIIVPIPIISFMPLFIESGLNFWLTVLLVTAGLTIGDGVAYMVGAAGRQVMSEGFRKRIDFFDNFRKKYSHTPFLLLFLFAALAPLPNEVLVIPMALAGYRFLPMFPFLLAGNLIYNTLVAFGFIHLFALIT
ncbi:MAG: hypothetical protein Q7S15_02775 [bacterium]|nr:hypothetical protein [bacterium]